MDLIMQGFFPSFRKFIQKLLEATLPSLSAL